jgi:HD-GYP domain-containing protein (c-di-GMP phosphodiesterase class II)
MGALQNALLILTVLSGPDAGRSLSFRKQRLSLGRDANCDFLLSDGFVSNRHGELVFINDRIEYHDLRSRHGTLVIINNVSTRLQDRDRNATIEIGDGTELQIGSSILKIELPESGKTLPPMEALTFRQDPAAVEARGDFKDRSNEQFITTIHEPIEAFSRRFEGQDKRLGVLFRLAEKLNSLTGLDDIMELIVESTFEAFPGANFFAVSLLTDGETVPRPYLMRARNDSSADLEPILSSSIVNRVLESRESVLWVKDNLGSQVSQSILDAKITACLCAPLVGQRKIMGVMQVDTRGRGSLFSKQDLDLFSILASNAAFALERAELTGHIVRMFESFVDASVTAIEARDPTTAGHSHRVSAYTLELARVVHECTTGTYASVTFSAQQFTEMRFGTLLHDFGKIGVPEDVLMKPTRLQEWDMENVRQRFEMVEALMHRNLWQAFAEGVSGGRVEPTASTVDEIKARCANVSSDLRADREFLDDVNIKGFLPDADLARVEEIAARSYVDAQGKRQVFLTPREIENLSIRRGTLNAREWGLMQSHAAQSQRFLERIPWGEDLGLVPYLGGYHHEKLDGSGYPLGVGADDLNVQVRMLTVADIFDALTAADRPYRKAATVERAISILQEEAGQNKLDSELVELFAERVVPKVLHIIPSNTRSPD